MVVVRGLYLSRHLLTLSPLKMWSRNFWTNIMSGKKRGKPRKDQKKCPQQAHSCEIQVPWQEVFRGPDAIDLWIDRIVRWEYNLS